MKVIERSPAQYRDVYGCIEHCYFFKIVRFIHNAMKYMINKTENKSSQQSLKKKIQRDRYKECIRIISMERRSHSHGHGRVISAVVTQRNDCCRYKEGFNT